MTMAEQLIAQGIQKGRQEGSQEAAENIARTMLNKGVPAELVQEYTALPIEKIEALKH